MSADPLGYTLERGTGSVGGGQLNFSGKIDAQGWSPTRYDVRGNLQDGRIAYLDFLPAMTGDAKMAVNGPADDLLLSGSITIDEMLFSERIDWESWILEVSGERLRDAVAEETADLFEMDIRVSSDNTIRMRNNVAGLTAGGELHLKGTTARPGMTGTIRAQPGGSVYLKERNFELQRAELTFLDPYSFDPSVDIAMFTDVRSREQDIEIEYLIRGQYSDWYAETRSNPPMSPADINALLLFGMTMEDLERYGGLSSALFVEGGDLLASKLGIVEQIGEGIFQYELFRLDRVDLISGVSERSYSAVTSELRLLAEKDLDWGGTLRLEQNLNRVSDTYISLEQKLARKLYLRGFYATEQQDRYLSIGGAYGVDMNVRWELD
jgi:autotransporter translocation and assembly factor TamB